VSQKRINKKAINNNDDPFLNYSRQLLDDSLDELDDSVLSRLQQSRQQAVKAATQLPKQSHAIANVNPFAFPRWLTLVSTGATFATIALIVTLLWTPPQPFPQQMQTHSFIEDINLLSQSEELELYQNLEFYLWLEDETNS